MSPQCKGQLYNGDPCPREVIDGSDYCIFHYPNKKGELAEKFQKALEDEIEKQEEEHPEYFDFTGFDFSNEITENFLRKQYESVFFNSAIFRKNAKFSSITSKFTFQEASFRDAVFEEEAWFAGAIFKEDASFYGATFKGTTEFIKAIFKKRARFQDTTFMSLVQFDRAKFENFTWFDGSTFEDRVDFNGVKFERYIGFRGTIFEEHTSFMHATFRNAIFNQAIFKSDTDFMDAIFRDAGFDDTILEGTTGFMGAIFKQRVKFEITISSYLFYENIIVDGLFYLKIKEYKSKEDIPRKYTCSIREPIIKENGKIIISGNLGSEGSVYAGISLINTDLDKFEFIDVDWLEYNGRKVIVDDIFLRDNSLKEAYYTSYFEPTYNQIAQTYRRLRDNFETARRYSEAGDFFIGEMEILRFYDPSLLNRILYTIYNYLGKYGESIIRPLIWMFISIFTISLLQNASTFIIKTPLQEFMKKIWSSLMNITKAFFPFHDITGIHEIPIRLLGSLLLALAFIAIRRRLERR